jgi:hypothetical protein
MWQPRASVRNVIEKAEIDWDPERLEKTDGPIKVLVKNGKKLAEPEFVEAEYKEVQPTVYEIARKRRWGKDV